MSIEEITDINDIIEDNTSLEVLDLSSPKIVFSFEERLEAFKNEWITFVKKEITENIEPWFHLWRGMGAANSSFLRKMEKLANKHFRGILNEDSIMRLQIFVKQLQYGITALISANKKTELEPILRYVETLSEESFEAIDQWNWPLVDQDMSRLQPYVPEDYIEEPEFDKTKNDGYPAWIRMSTTRCACEDSDCDSTDSATDATNDTTCSTD
jgi:hypothetical protein